MKSRIVAALLASAVALGCPHAFAGSTIDPAQPANGSPLNSAPLRANFQAAYNDINNILSMYYGPTAPSAPSNFQSWANSSSYPVVTLNYYNAATATWVQYGVLNVATNTYASSVGTTATAPLSVTFNNFIPTFALNYSASFSLNSGALALNLPTPSIPGGILSSTAPANQFATGVNTSGDFTYAQPSFGNISGINTASQGGSGIASPAAHSLMVAEGSAPYNLLAASIGGRVLLDQGPNLDPLFVVMSGDGTLAPDGTFTLANSGVTAGTYGDGTHSTQVTFDAKGRATSASSVAITHASGDLAAASNLSDLASASTARGNLGLGNLATQNAGAGLQNNGNVTNLQPASATEIGGVEASQNPPINTPFTVGPLPFTFGVPGQTGTPTASFVGDISGTQLAVRTLNSGTVAIGETITGNGVSPAGFAGATQSTIISAASTGCSGTYLSCWTVNNSQTVSSGTSMNAISGYQCSGSGCSLAHGANKFVTGIDTSGNLITRALGTLTLSYDGRSVLGGSLGAGDFPPMPLFTNPIIAGDAGGANQYGPPTLAFVNLDAPLNEKTWFISEGSGCLQFGPNADSWVGGGPGGAPMYSFELCRNSYLPYIAQFNTTITATANPAYGQFTNSTGLLPVAGSTLSFGGASFTGSISGTTLTVSSISAGIISVGQTINGAGITAGTTVTSLGTGTGGVGTYILSAPQTLSSESMSAAATTVTFVSSGASGLNIQIGTDVNSTVVNLYIALAEARSGDPNLKNLNFSDDGIGVLTAQYFEGGNQGNLYLISASSNSNFTASGTTLNPANGFAGAFTGNLNVYKLPDGSQGNLSVQGEVTGNTVNSNGSTYSGYYYSACGAAPWTSGCSYEFINYGAAGGTGRANINYDNSNNLDINVKSTIGNAENAITIHNNNGVPGAITSYGTTFVGSASDAFSLQNTAGSATVPTIVPNKSDGNAGIGAYAAGGVSIVVDKSGAGYEALRADTNGDITIPNLTTDGVVTSTGGKLGTVGTVSTAQGGFGSDNSSASGIPIFASGVVSMASLNASGGIPQINGTPTIGNCLKWSATGVQDAGAAACSAGGFTVATLPAGTIGEKAYVTDATSCTFLGALTGGGSAFCPVVYNGSAWVGG